MNLNVVALCLFGLLATVTHGQNKPAEKKNPAQKQDKKAEVVFKTAKDKFSYCIGLDYGRRIERDGLQLNVDPLVKGLVDALNKVEPKLSAKELREARIAYRNVKSIKKAGASYLAKNKTQKGVVTTKSGLQYKILKAGTGKSPQKTDTVTIRYFGTLTNGTPFDGSHRNRPGTTPVTGRLVIKGWTEALQLMKVGAKWKLFIPSHLAWGEHPIFSNVGPNEVLLYEIELLEIVK